MILGLSFALVAARGTHPRLARETRLRLWTEHMERSVKDVSGAPARVVDTLWGPIAREQLERRGRGEP
jgi:hypothetical protein